MCFLSLAKPPGLLTLILCQGEPPVQGIEDHNRDLGMTTISTALWQPRREVPFVFSVVRVILQPLLQDADCPILEFSPQHRSLMCLSEGLRWIDPRFTVSWVHNQRNHIASQQMEHQSYVHQGNVKTYYRCEKSSFCIYLEQAER